MAESLSDVWVDADSFEARWDIQGDHVGKGGQGIGFRAIRRSDRREAFIKVFDSNHGERRARSFVEASAYEALTGADVPQLIESNAHMHEDKDVRLYIATEFIEGPTLRRWRDKVRKVSLTDAVDITLHLLETVVRIHDKGILHRDIKPDNIMMSQGMRPVLVDFGIAFNRMQILKKVLTSDGNRLGNQFLSLPELFGASRNKRNIVSDLTTVSGIFLYLLTGANPIQLRDGEGYLPHQRENIRSKLKKAGLDKVYPFFDRAFQADTPARFQTAGEVRLQLLKIRNQISEPEAIGDLSELQSILENPLFQIKGQTSSRLRMALNWAMGCYQTAHTHTYGNLKAQQVDISDRGSPGYIRIRWDLHGDYRACTHLWVEIVGSEIIWHNVTGEVFRAPINSELDQSAQDQFTSNAVLPDIVRIVKTDPKELPEEFPGRFVLRNRLAFSLDEACKKSESYGVPVLVIAYHDSKTESDRSHLLHRILDDSHIQEIILKSFVVLIVRRSEITLRTEIPESVDLHAVLNKGHWTHIRHLAANREAAKMDLTALQKEFS